MGVRIVSDRDEGRAALYDSVSGFAFGPTFTGSERHCLDAADEALAFCEWLAECGGPDPRTLPDPAFESLLGIWGHVLDDYPDTSVDREVLVRNLAADTPAVQFGAAIPA